MTKDTVLNGFTTMVGNPGI